ncbi:hypothetical protein CMI48_00130 [Candidatus Pacearchaeota archaeon]|nr:hypothetical protein [Candidatus Pacearchaeota archaeon]|tara:strand:- start:131 stop:850 length:720 start_codon:yes stop_codon:yes gene_type:complete
MTEELFRLLDLSEKEEMIYETLLKGGPQSVLEISHKTSFNRTFCYDLIEKMIKKGVILQSKSSKKIYQAAPLEQLEILIEKAYLDSKKEIEKLKEVEKSKEDETEMLEFKGHFAVFNLFRRLISQKEEIKSFWSKRVGQLFQEFLEENVKLRINKKIPLKVLTEDSEWTKKWLKKLSFEESHRKIKYLKDFNFDSTIYIFNGEIAIITYKKGNPYGLLIRNKEYYETQKKIFDELWKTT